MSEVEFDTAPVKHKLFDRLPMSHEMAAQAVEIFIVPWLERAGMTVKVTKTKTTRTLKITLPTK